MVTRTVSKNDCDGMALFRAESRLLGLCRGAVQLGDVICRVSGGKYLFLLRRARREAWDQREIYLIGVARVHSLDLERRGRCGKRILCVRELSQLKLCRCRG